MGDVRRLIRGRRERVLSRCDHGFTALHYAVLRGHAGAARVLIEEGRAPLDVEDEEGNAPLNVAADRGHLEVLRLLVTRGAAVDKPNRDGKTALVMAAEMGHVAVVRVLVGAGASLNARDIYGKTILHHAAERGQTSMVRMLLLETIVAMVVDVADAKGHTALHIAAWYDDCAEIAALLLEEGLATIDPRGGDTDATPLILAADKGYQAVVRVLLEHGAVVNAKTVDSCTALHFAAQEGHFETVRALLDYGARFDALSDRGYTPVDLAAKYSRMDVLQLLLRSGAMVVLAMNKLGLRIERQVFLEDEVIFSETPLPAQILGTHRRPCPHDDEDVKEEELSSRLRDV